MHMCGVVMLTWWGYHEEAKISITAIRNWYAAIRQGSPVPWNLTPALGQTSEQRASECLALADNAD